MAELSPLTATRTTGRFLTNTQVSAGLVQLDMELPQPLSFLPGQFAMVNLAGDRSLVFSRPLSILAVSGNRLSFLYRVVGRGTSALADLRCGQEVTILGPLGRPFPSAEELPDTAAVLIAGGVGLPPLHNWLVRYGRPGDVGFFGGRDGNDIPWDLLDERWQVSVDHAVAIPADREARPGLVTACAAEHPLLADDRARVVLSCGPLPMLRAVARWAAERGWVCHVSLEEHMGCGYGVCKGCVVPVRLSDGPGTRNATCCDEGPVFAAESIDWERYGNG